MRSLINSECLKQYLKMSSGAQPTLLSLFPLGGDYRAFCGVLVQDPLEGRFVKVLKMKV